MIHKNEGKKNNSQLGVPRSESFTCPDRRSFRLGLFPPRFIALLCLRLKEYWTQTGMEPRTPALDVFKENGGGRRIGGSGERGWRSEPAVAAGACGDEPGAGGFGSQPCGQRGAGSRSVSAASFLSLFAFLFYYFYPHTHIPSGTSSCFRFSKHFLFGSSWAFEI